MKQEVEVGQIYKDRDKRENGRTGSVQSIEGDAAWLTWDQSGRRTKIKLTRLQSSKYELLGDA